MNGIKNALLVLAVFGTLLISPPGTRGQEAPSLPPGGERFTANAPQISPPEKKGSLRESDILGTVEKPGLSSRLPWKNPEGVETGAARLHRSFIKEIFRPIGPDFRLSDRPVQRPEGSVEDPSFRPGDSKTGSADGVRQK